jgi:hypothetical protein
LNEAVADFATIIEGQDWTTADPLGLGGLLMDAARVAQLMHLGAIAGGELLESLLVAALQGLSHYARQDELRRPASQRLAFREIGLAIGLSAVELIEKETETEHRHLSRGAEVLERIEALTPYVALGSAIKSFWLEPEHREARTWSEHRDINEVMLATSLVPTGFLDIRSIATSTKSCWLPASSPQAFWTCRWQEFDDHGLSNRHLRAVAHVAVALARHTASR